MTKILTSAEQAEENWKKGKITFPEYEKAVLATRHNIGDKSIRATRDVGTFGTGIIKVLLILAVGWLLLQLVPTGNQPKPNDYSDDPCDNTRNALCP